MKHVWWMTLVVACVPRNENRLIAETEVLVAADLHRALEGPAMLRAGITAVNEDSGPLTQLLEDVAVVCPEDEGPIVWAGRLTREAITIGRREAGLGPCLPEPMAVAAELVPLSEEACPADVAEGRDAVDEPSIAITFDWTFPRSRLCITEPVEVELLLDSPAGT
ncbi:MAG: hypothetical protein KTR31_12620 [Myxococcales bacterium]|nr:hypothetical protein [Myxococcales bacterium]